MPAPAYEMTFRPRPTPAAGLPLGARSVGRHRVPAGWSEGPSPKHGFVQVCWGVAGRGTLAAPGGPVPLGPGQTLALPPGQVHHYQADGPWEFRWWTLDGPAAAALVAATGLDHRPRDAGPAPLARLAALREAIADPGGERRASALAYGLLLEAAAPWHPGDPLVAEALAVMAARWDDPAFGIAALALALGVHRSGLSRRFHAERGMPPQEHLVHLRLGAAVDLLAAGGLSVAEVARRCGFSDPAYLARVLRQRTGHRPGDLRRGR